MTTEIPQGQEQAPATTELPNGAAAAPADGVGAPAETQQTQEPQPEPQTETPEHRKASYRFSEMSKQLRKQAEENAYLRGQIDALGRGGAQPQQQTQPEAPQAVADPEPSPEAYPGKEFDPKYVRDLALWSGRETARELARQQAEARETETRAEAQRREFEEGRARFLSAREEAEVLEDSNPQLAGVVAATLDDIARSEPPGTPGRMIDLVTRVENKAWVAAAFATKPDLRREIQALDPVSRALAIGRIDAQISANLRMSQAAKPAPTAPTPPPVAPSAQPALTAPPQVNGGGTASASFNAEKADFADFERYFAAKRGGQLS